MNPILQALRAGHSAEKILRYLSGTNSELASKINSALGLGYTAKAVLDFVFNAGKSVSNVLPTPTKEETSLYKRADYIDPGLKRSLLTGGTLLAGLGLASTAGKVAGSVLPEILPALEEQAPTTPPIPGAPINPPEGIPQSPGQIATPQTPMPGPNIGQQIQQGVQQPLEQAMQPMQQGEVAGAAQALPPQQIIPDATPPQKLTSAFDELIKNVNVELLSPEKKKQLQFIKTISDQLEKKGTPITDPAYKNLAKKVDNIIKGKPGTVVEESARISEIEPTKQPEKLEKGSSVITPSGDLAKIEDLPGKTAKVNVDGKKQVFETDDLVPIPDNHEEIGNLYQQLIDKIPEGDKSRVYDAIGYDPERNAIKYTYHDGKTYIIDDVPEDIAKEIANSGFMAKTSGGNYMGFYYKGNPSIGAGMSVLINDLQKQRGGKGKEYSYKFEELYSQHRLPKNILKKRAEKEKQRAREEKEAKKKRITS